MVKYLIFKILNSEFGISNLDSSILGFFHLFPQKCQSYPFFYHYRKKYPVPKK